ncbi:MAG: hypothetical protein EA360_11090 [Balneolaceae bacterium]|nr:MAG: hypothetical protein EA360_11090 [Balneolaceae bacterium]
MKYLKFLVIAVVILFLAGVAGYFAWFHNPYEHTLQLDPVSVYGDRPEGFLLTNVNIVDVESGTLSEAQHLFVREGVIEDIFTGPIPDSLSNAYPVMDASGKFIMPALIDMHAHLNTGGLIPPDESGRLMALEQYARYGVGLVYTLGGHGFNQEVTRDLIQKQKNREIVAPLIYATGDIFTAPGGYPIEMISMMSGVSVDKIDLAEEGVIVVDDETDLVKLISIQKELGMNGIKVMVETGLGGGPEIPRLSTEIIRNIVEIASEQQLTVFAHVTRQADFEDAIDAGVHVIGHTVGDQLLTNADSYFDKMRENHIYYTPTLSIAYIPQYVATAEVLDDPFMLKYSSERTVRSLRSWLVRKLMLSMIEFDAESVLENMLQNFVLFHEAGVPVLMGADAGNPSVMPGYSAHRELEYMVAGGMSVTDALRSATIDPARFLGHEDRMGSIAEGKSASFLLLERNPLEDVRNTQTIERVMLEGYWLENK